VIAVVARQDHQVERRKPVDLEGRLGEPAREQAVSQVDVVARGQEVRVSEDAASSGFPPGGRASEMPESRSAAYCRYSIRAGQHR
jgi:hypothetical protein